MCALGRTNATYDLLHCLLTFQMSPEVTDRADPKWLGLPRSLVAKSAFCEISRGPETGCGIHFHLGRFMVPPLTVPDVSLGH